ncbi:unnamed protein product [Rotaria sordida]|uniref:ABC transporter domain-containing protein n=1 Tax=Rotaria sordida TaxID=392033 RepID=A0A815C8H1_9BILA|nr:unnamed protein product [Rotaria sordida]
MILAIYIERINPGEFGISQPWNYLCKKGYWKSQQVSSIKQTKINKNKDKDYSTIENNHWIESSSLANTKLPVLSINHMTKMRQMRRKEAEESIDNILNLIGLVDQQHTWANNLSGGMKRRLSIGISLVGDSKVLILDEPTSGIDPYNRRLIWTIIRKMKEAGKCIILTTHFLEEADVLSDRIAVMSKGRLQANGTPEFLKQQTDFEYRIFIEKNETCDIQHVTKFFQEHIQTAVLERQSASELVFGIKRGASQRISRLINTLDEQGPNIGIKGYGLSMTTVEEVFLKLVEEETNEIKQNQEKSKANLAKTVFFRNHNHITGFYLIWIRFSTFIIKRWILSRRQIFVLFGFFLGPLLIEILTISTLSSPKDIQASLLQNERVKNAQVTLIPSIYNPQTIVIHSNENGNQIKGYLKNYLTNMNANIEEISTNNIIDYILSRNNNSYDTYVNKYQMGFSIDKRSTLVIFNVFFSTVNYHTMATGLSIATTCLFQYYANSSLKSIQTINQPILTSSASVTARAIFYDRIYCFDTVPLSLLNFINSFIASIFISILALNVIRERISHSKDLQLLTNTSKKLYWFSNFLYDLTLCWIVSALLTIVVKIGSVVHPNPEVEVQIYKGTEQISYFFLLYVMYSLASLPFMYSYSFIPESELIGFIMFLIVNVFACFFDMVLGFIAVFSQASPSSSTDKMGTTTQVMLILRLILAGFFPTVNFKQSLFNIRLRSDPTCVSVINSIMITNYSSDEPWTSLNEPGIGLQLVIFTVQIVVWWTILTCIENRVKIGQLICCCFNRKEHMTIDRKRKQVNSNNSTMALEWNDSKLDKDVRDERRMILNNKELFTSSVVLARDLVQQFKKRKGKSLFSPYFTAVDHLNFYVPKQSCFGLLGANGAGKTTTFRMLINDIQPTAGEIIINGKKINQTKRNIGMGFCPQFDWLIEDLNVAETLTLFARLKGLSTAEIPITCNEMIELFDLEPYRNREVKNLSGGNKRKVSAAVAFMANPSLVFLDEPTTGLDAGAKRKLWSVIRAARDAGLTIIMTSHSMEECEALCTKIGIMKSGQFICLGNLQHLKNRFGKGYSVQVKVSREKMNEFQQELATNEQNGVLFCNVPFSSSASNNIESVPFSSNLSLIFEILNTKKEQNIIENYSVTQTTLEQIFVRLAGYDINDDNTLTETPSVSSQSNLNTATVNQVFVIDCTVSTCTLDNLDSDQFMSAESIDIHL